MPRLPAVWKRWRHSTLIISYRKPGDPSTSPVQIQIVLSSTRKWRPKQNLRSRYCRVLLSSNCATCRQIPCHQNSCSPWACRPSLSLVLESVWPAWFKWNVKSLASMLRTSHVKPEGLQRSWRVNRKPFVMQKSSSSQQNWEETTDKLSWCTFFLATNSFKSNFGIGKNSYRQLSSKHFILLALLVGKFFCGKKHIAVLHWLTLTSQPDEVCYEDVIRHWVYKLHDKQHMVHTKRLNAAGLSANCWATYHDSEIFRGIYNYNQY